MTTLTTEPQYLTARDEEDVQQWLQEIHQKLQERQYQRKVEAGRVFLWIGSFSEDLNRYEPKEKVKARIKELMLQEGWSDLKFPELFRGDQRISLRTSEAVRADDAQAAHEETIKYLKIGGIALGIAAASALGIVVLIVAIPILLIWAILYLFTGND